MVATTRNKEKWRESSEDMNKGAGEMDEGSGERQERDRDGWSEEPGCTGAQLRRETIHRCTEEIWERLWKNDKSRSWGRWDNEQRQRGRSECVCAKGGDRGLEGDVEGKKGKFIGKDLERRGRDAKIRRSRKCLEKITVTERKETQTETLVGEETIEKQIRPAQHVLLPSTPFKMVALF